ncbi:CynX/NimT family MFS transporter [Pseudarthrobacter sp. J1738]|uniref:MFS transporter n=1 Tax=Pseudarthrobacter sp. J1738 TaxID=3420446 RepID=UPI003D2CE5DA
MSNSAVPLHKKPRAWLLVLCVALIAMNMRGPFVAVAPVVGDLQRELGLSAVELGLLTSIPVLCFAVASPFASWSGRKFGAEFSILLTLAGVLLGVVLRSAGGSGLAIVGTILIGVAITIGNIAVPLIVRRDFSPARQGSAMGIYTAALNIGSFITSMTTAPLAEWLGWRISLASCGLLAVAALVAWLWVIGPRRALIPEAVALPDGPPPTPHSGSGIITLGLTLGFAGQAFSYYGVTAWLPSFLSDELGMSRAGAGAGSSLFQILAIVGGLGVPLAARFASTTTVAITLGALWVTVPGGLLLAPNLWWLWSALGGVAQGGGITIIFLAIIKLARDQAAAGRMSAVVQGSGYAAAAVSPLLIGFVHDQSHSWFLPLLLLLASTLLFFIATVLSVRKVPRGA